MADSADKAAPEPGPTAEFWAYLRAGRFMIQRSRASGRYTFYPRTILPGTGEIDLDWVPASGRGTVYSVTTIRRRPDRGGDFNVSIVELEEGPRLTTRVLGVPPDQVRIGMKVTARIEAPSWRAPAADAQPVLVFYPTA